MENLFRVLLGNGTYPFPLDEIESYARYYESNCINIVITKANISFTAGPQIHSHDSYEFLIPFKVMPYIGCEDRCFFVPKNMVFPFNPLQAHGPQGEMINSLFASIHIERNFMSKVAKDAFGEKKVVFINEPFPLSSKLKNLIGAFTEESSVKTEVGDSLVLECLSTQIAVQLVRDYRTFHEANGTTGGANSEAGLAKILQSFHENYSNTSYSTQSAAKEANLSKYYFIKAFKNETGKTPYNYLLDLRIEKTKLLLKEGSCTITEIYSLCGFINHSHFTSTFKKKVGMSPSMFRKVHSLG